MLRLSTLSVNLCNAESLAGRIKGSRGLFFAQTCSEVNR